MSIYSNDNISKIAKLTPRELPHLVQNRENNYAKIMAYTVILVKYARKILKSTRRSCKYLPIQNFPERKWSPHLPWHGDETISAATPLHCLSMGLLSNCQNLQKVGHDIVIFNGNVLGHAWHTWCKKGTNRKRMSCSSPICHMQIFNHLTLEQWAFEYGLPLFWYARIRTVYNHRHITQECRNISLFWHIYFQFSCIDCAENKNCFHISLRSDTYSIQGFIDYKCPIEESKI